MKVDEIKLLLLMIHRHANDLRSLNVLLDVCISKIGYDKLCKFIIKTLHILKDHVDTFNFQYNIKDIIIFNNFYHLFLKHDIQRSARSLTNSSMDN